MDKRVMRIGIAISFVIVLFAVPASAATVNVVGENDVNVDRQNIQDAIDSAPGEELRVILQGTFQLDGQRIFVTRSNLTIKSNKHGAILVGVTDQDGIPALGIESGRAFEVRQQFADTPITNLEFKGLEFRDIVRGINIVGFNPLGASAEVSNVVIKDNRMENVDVGVGGFGRVSHIVIKSNVIRDALGAAIFIRSYAAEFGPDQKLSNVVIKNNFMSTAPSNNPFPVVFQGEGSNSDVEVKGNTFQGGIIAVALLGDPTNFIVKGNCIRDGGTQGLPGLRSGGIVVGLELLGFTGSGYEVRNNSYANNVSDYGGIPLERRDVWLTPLSMNTSVTEQLGTVVLDDGVSNSIVLHGDDVVDFCDTGS